MIIRSKWVQITILSAVILAGAWTIATSLWQPEAPQAGDRAPDFRLYGLEGQEYKLSDYKGQYVVLNFWGSWCPPCVREMPLLQQTYEKWHDRGVTVLGLNLDESIVTVQGFIDRYKIDFPILLDRNVVVKQYGAIQYPTTFLISPDGIIYAKIEGELNDNRRDANDIEFALTSLLNDDALNSAP